MVPAHCLYCTINNTTSHAHFSLVFGTEGRSSDDSESLDIDGRLLELDFVLL